MVKALSGVVKNRTALRCANNFFQRHRFIVRAFDEVIQGVVVGFVVLTVVIGKRLRTHVRFKSVHCKGKRGYCKCHNFNLLNSCADHYDMQTPLVLLYLPNSSNKSSVLHHDLNIRALFQLTDRHHGLAAAIKRCCRGFAWLDLTTPRLVPNCADGWCPFQTFESGCCALKYKLHLKVLDPT